MPAKRPFKSSGNRSSRPLTGGSPDQSPEPSPDSSAIIPLQASAPAKPRRIPAQPFHFLSLPSELRIKIYDYFFQDTLSPNTNTSTDDPVVDLGPGNFKRIHKKLALMRVCRLVHAEATHFFYSTRTFRLFPTYPGRYFKSKKPLLARLKPLQRECLTSLELRLGPGWNAPPKGWVVTDALGLADCTALRRLSVFVECDPSDGVFTGFRRSEGFYESFCRCLLADVLARLPNLAVIEFDAWSSVQRSGAMMRGLLDVAAPWVLANQERCIRWGLERGWTDQDDDDDQPRTDRAVKPVLALTTQAVRAW